MLGAFSSAFLLYGIALTYGATGSTNLVRIQAFLSEVVITQNGLLLAGMAFMLVGFGFKVGAVPFHSWVPDVYQGSPSPVSGFMASGIKAAGFAGLLRVFVVTLGPTYADDWRPMVYALAVLSLLVGSLFAIVQTNVKRMLAYSSISHAGFILVAVEAASAEGTSAALFYLLAYTFMVVGSFGIVTIMGRGGDGLHTLEDYKGLGRTRPGIALLFSVFLLAQAGVPFTGGFLAKFYVINSAVAEGQYVLAVIAMVAAVIGAFLYLRIVVAMYFDGNEYGGEFAELAGPARADPRRSCAGAGARGRGHAVARHPARRRHRRRRRGRRPAGGLRSLSDADGPGGPSPAAAEPSVPSPNWVTSASSGGRPCTQFVGAQPPPPDPVELGDSRVVGRSAAHPVRQC